MDSDFTGTEKELRGKIALAKQEAINEIKKSDMFAGVVTVSKGHVHGIVLGGGNAHTMILNVITLRQLADELAQTLASNIPEDKLEGLFKQVASGTKKTTKEDDIKVIKLPDSDDNEEKGK